ncbi:MAG: SHOCT domain-containing protein [Proteobacteria bacterium]|nr:SHOCT domain-containing protein [Pseudomonadota bacterium]
MFSLISVAVQAQGVAQRSGWEGWPFSGVGSPWVAGAARLLFVLLVFVGIAWVLRLLFGPGGRLRPDEFGTGHIDERKLKKTEAKVLRQRWKDGELSDDDYDAALKALWKDDV